MFTLYDQDEISKQYDQYLKDKSRAEGRAEGREAMAINMHQNGLDIKTIAKVAEVSEEQVQQWIDEVLGQAGDNAGEGTANDDTNGHVQHIAAKCKLFELLQEFFHGTRPPLK